MRSSRTSGHSGQNDEYQPRPEPKASEPATIMESDFEEAYKLGYEAGLKAEKAESGRKGQCCR